ncbi:hypothetical protein B9Z65_1182 [Elsinoe australis]|uniref:Uncharacterized protein n=1 Tax=Elsinoe australis TaxID=40998 RepID=A0A2P7YPV5_9PEZI|nr:hypothetical protein B9Z65_1182 [Elsinoe australis]
MAAYSIQQDEFLTFIDGFNEAFVAHPIFQGLGIAGAVMGMAYGVHPVQWAGLGLQIFSGMVSSATSYLRARQYVQAINMELFNPAGLHVTVMTTKKMMAKIGLPGEQLKLHPLSADAPAPNGSANILAYESQLEFQQLPKLEHARAQSLEALQGHVMPLDFNVPEAKTPDNQSSKKKREKANEEIVKMNAEADKEQRKGDKDVLKKQCEAEKEISKLERELEREKSVSKRLKASKKLQNEKSKLLNEVEKEAKKRDEKVESKRQDARKEIEKVGKSESKIANKIRWLVISKWEGQESDMSEDEDS